MPTSHNVHNALCFERGEMANLWYRMHSLVYVCTENLKSGRIYSKLLAKVLSERWDHNKIPFSL